MSSNFWVFFLTERDVLFILYFYSVYFLSEWKIFYYVSSKTALSVFLLDSSNSVKIHLSWLTQFRCHLADKIIDEHVGWLSRMGITHCQNSMCQFTRQSIMCHVENENITRFDSVKLAPKMCDWIIHRQATSYQWMFVMKLWSLFLVIFFGLKKCCCVQIEDLLFCL